MKRIGMWSDNHNYPSLSLMKIAAWHKQLGHEAELWQPDKRYDITYISKVFTESHEPVINGDCVISGGSGYDLRINLPPAIEHIYPHYDLDY